MRIMKLSAVFKTGVMKTQSAPGSSSTYPYVMRNSLPLWGTVSYYEEQSPIMRNSLPLPLVVRSREVWCEATITWHFVVAFCCSFRFLLILSILFPWNSLRNVCRWCLRELFSVVWLFIFYDKQQIFNLT